MIRLAKVIDIKDPLEKGRVKVRIYPELNGLKTDDLPWADPIMPVYNNVSLIPKLDSFLYTEVSDDWVEFKYSDSVDYILENYKYADVKETLDSIDEIESVNYPDPDFKINPNGFIEFYNKTNKETGYIHPSNTFVIFKENGDYYIKNPDMFEMHFSENKIEMKNLKKFTVGSESGAEFSLDTENKKLSISGIESVEFEDTTKFSVGSAENSAVLYAPLKAILDTLKTHTHPWSQVVPSTSIATIISPAGPCSGTLAIGGTSAASTELAAQNGSEIKSEIVTLD